MPDICKREASSLQVLINTGTGFAPSENWENFDNVKRSDISWDVGAYATIPICIIQSYALLASVLLVFFDLTVIGSIIPLFPVTNIGGNVQSSLTREFKLNLLTLMVMVSLIIVLLTILIAFVSDLVQLVTLITSEELQSKALSIFYFDELVY